MGPSRTVSDTVQLQKPKCPQNSRMVASFDVLDGAASEVHRRVHWSSQGIPLAHSIISYRRKSEGMFGRVPS